jgi:hypothetical protein
MKIPREKSVAAIEVWEESFFQNEFTHVAGVRNQVRYPGGFLSMWESLEGKRKFPSCYLVEAKQTVAEFVNVDDHRYRNQNQ